MVANTPKFDFERVASLQIKDAALSARRRRDLATWLRRQADHLLKRGKEYAPRYRASLNYRNG